MTAKQDGLTCELVRMQTIKKKTTKTDLDKFRSGPVRGVTAAGKTLKGGVDPSDIDRWLGTIDQAVLKMRDTTTQSEIASFIDATIKTAQEVAKVAKAKVKVVQSHTG